MNTAKHTTTTVTRHKVRMDNTSSAGISRRDLGDFLHQADQAFEKAKGRPVEYDDDYYVTGDEEGITATFETEQPKLQLSINSARVNPEDIVEQMRQDTRQERLG